MDKIILIRCSHYLRLSPGEKNNFRRKAANKKFNLNTKQLVRQKRKKKKNSENKSNFHVDEDREKIKKEIGDALERTHKPALNPAGILKQVRIIFSMATVISKSKSCQLLKTWGFLRAYNIRILT